MTQPLFMTFLSPARLMRELARGPITEQRAGVAREVSAGFCGRSHFLDDPIRPGSLKKPSNRSKPNPLLRARRI